MAIDQIKGDDSSKRMKTDDKLTIRVGMLSGITLKMKGFIAFFKKEIKELIRTKRLMILLGIFILVGIMNPAIAKLTPLLFEKMSDEFASQGITLSAIKVSAVDSWSQFAKNAPTVLIVTLIMFSGIYTSEYSKGTLIPLLTKGLSRSSVVLSKLTVMLLTWSIGIWLCYVITYFYSDFYWDNSVVKELFFAAFCWWLFGVFMISIIVFFSSFANSGIQVMLCTGAAYFVISLLGMYSKIKNDLPIRLTESVSLYKGESVPGDYFVAAIITAILSVALILLSLPITHKRQI